MNPRAEKPLRDVLRVCDEAAAITQGRTFEDAESSVMLRRSLERIVHLVGELLVRAIKVAPDLVDEIPAARNIIGMRNRIAHGYEEIRDEVVWDAATVRLPLLRNHLEQLLEQGPRQS